MHAPQLATWPSGLGKGLQSPVPGFDSLRRLYFVVRVNRPVTSSQAAVVFATPKLKGVGVLPIDGAKLQRVVSNWGIDWTGVYLQS